MQPLSIIIAIAAATAIAANSAAAQRGDPEIARSLAATCAGCHGTDGVSQGVIESLAGMRKDEIILKMQAFKTGARPATVMHQLARGYTDPQVELIADWYAAQPAPRK